MYKATLNRRAFLDTISRAYPGQLPLTWADENLNTPADGGDFQVIWAQERPKEERPLPSMVVIPKREQRDFLSWTYTYVSTLRPFTAYIRVVDPCFLTTIDKARTKPGLGGLTETFLGAIIGEALTYLEPRFEIKSLVPSAFANTHSFALTRSLMLGLDEHLDEASLAWNRVGELTHQAKRNLDARTLAVPSLVLRHLYSGSRYSEDIPPPLIRIARACREILDAGDIDIGTWQQLTAPIGRVSDIREQMNASREVRVRAFDQVWDWFSTHRDNDPELIGFICGYLASKIAPGELNHFSLVARMLAVAPTTVVWFGVCSGLQSRGQVFEFADGLGRRIQRDLEQVDDVLGRPRCDLALAELELLISRDKPLTDFRTASGGLLTIELIPCVTTSIKWQRSTDAQTELFERRAATGETRALVRDLSLALEKVDLIKRQLLQQLDLDSDEPPYKPDKRPRRR